MHEKSKQQNLQFIAPVSPIWENKNRKKFASKIAFQPVPKV